MELYDTDLNTLSKLLQYVEDISQEGVFSVEIRVRMDDTSWWAVLGWGEAGDPCVLRFEEDPKPIKPVTLTRDISPFTTINCVEPPMKDYDQRF